MTIAAGRRPAVPTTALPAVGADRPLPGALGVGWARAGIELRMFVRNKASLVFTLSLPVLLLLILGSIFGGTVEGTDIDFKQVFIAGIVAAGVMSVAFTGLAITMAIERDDGSVRRLGATPMPRSAYFFGKVVLVLVTGLVETTVLVAIGVIAFHLPLPADLDRWLRFGWVLGLGAMACALCGIAYSWVIPNARSASAIVTPPFMVLQFISGVFFPFSSLPSWMQTVAALFPLKWMAQGLRSVFLPDSFQLVEPAGSWEIGRTAMVLGGWCVLGLVLCLISFRWRGPKVR
jgi:ABC-2 type transport system permease protein